MAHIIVEYNIYIYIYIYIYIVIVVDGGIKLIDIEWTKSMRVISLQDTGCRRKLLQRMNLR